MLHGACCWVQLDVLSRQGDLIEAPERLTGRGKPLCADFDGGFAVA